jgi:hypothetical protein
MYLKVSRLQDGNYMQAHLLKVGRPRLREAELSADKSLLLQGKLL